MTEHWNFGLNCACVGRIKLETLGALSASALNFAKWLCRTHRLEMKQLTEHRNCVKSFVVIFILGASIATAHAQNAPWCLQSDAFDGDRSCAYDTFQQCLADRNFLNGFCVQNSTYRPPARRRRL
jgi:Protein of unknown function (DUF3551)